MVLRPRFVVTLAGVIALQVATGAQPPSGTQPTFRTGTTLVEVSAVVTRDGRPVTDLRAVDFTVLDNGKPQPLVAFEFVDLTAKADAPEQRRDFVLVLDDLGIEPKHTVPARDVGAALVAGLGQYDRLAVVNTGPHELVQQLSTDRESARTLLRRFRGQKTGMTSAYQVCHATVVKLKVISNAVAGRILVDPKSGRADGVQYFHRKTGREYQVKAKVVALGASCIDSTRILLNSKSKIYPNGIGNTSGVIGKYLCEQFRFHVTGFLPRLYGRETTHDSGIGGEHVYLPRFNHRGKKRDYARGFGMQFWGIGCQAGAGWAKGLAGFGADFKRDVRKRYPAWIEMHPYGEVPPRAENHVTVEGTPTDKYGVPLPKIVMRYGENEMKMLPEMYDTVERILREAKAEIVELNRGAYDPPGTAIHNVELKKGKGGQLVRSAGVAAQLMAKDGDYAQVRLPSGEIRKVHLDCRATVGQVSNSDHANVPHNQGRLLNAAR